MKDLEIIAVTYNHGPKLKVFVNSLLAQTYQNYYCRIFHDGMAEDGSDTFMEQIIKDYPENFDYIESDHRMDVHGHQNRAVGIQEAKSSLLFLTNCDNYQVPVFVEAATKVFKDRDIDVLTFNILHNYDKYNKIFSNQNFALCKTDMSGFVIKREIAQSVPFTPGMGNGNSQWDKQKDFAADGFWIEKIKKAHPRLRLMHLPMCLGVHN